MTSDGELSDFETRLDRELREQIGRLEGPSPRVSQSAYHAVYLKGGNWMSFFKTKAGIGLAAAVLTLGGGSAVAAAATGSANPEVWGKTVTATVDSCKDKLAPGEHGIGRCVSAVAKKHGAEEKDEKADHDRATPSPSNKPRIKPEESPDNDDSSHGRAGFHGHDNQPSPKPEPSLMPEPSTTPDDHDHPRPHSH